MASNQDCPFSSLLDMPLIMASNQESTSPSHSDPPRVDVPSATNNEQIAEDDESSTAAIALSHSDMPPPTNTPSDANNEQLPGDDEAVKAAVTTTTITEVDTLLLDRFGAEAVTAHAPKWLATIASNIGHQSLVDILVLAASEAIQTAIKRAKVESQLKDFVVGKHQEILNELISSLPGTSKGKRLPLIGPAVTYPITDTPPAAENKPATGKKRKAASAGLENASASEKKARKYDHTLATLLKTQANVKLDVGTKRFICAIRGCPVNENRADELSRHYRSASDKDHDAKKKLGVKPYFEVHKQDYKKDEGLNITMEATTAEEWYDKFDETHNRADPNYQIKSNSLRTNKKKKKQQQVEDEGTADGATDEESDVDSDDDDDGDDDGDDGSDSGNGDGNEVENDEAGTSPKHDGETGNVDKGKGKAIPEACEDNNPAPPMENDTAMEE